MSKRSTLRAPEFRIGSPVCVRAVIAAHTATGIGPEFDPLRPDRTGPDTRRTLNRTPLDSPLIGVITGIKRRKTGLIESVGCDCDMGEGYGCGHGNHNEFVAHRVVALYEFKTSMSGKPEEAFPSDVVAEEPFDLLRNPSPGYTPAEMDLYRDSMRKEMENWPRDASGKWVKKPKETE